MDLVLKFLVGQAKVGRLEFGIRLEHLAQRVIVGRDRLGRGNATPQRVVVLKRHLGQPGGSLLLLGCRFIGWCRCHLCQVHVFRYVGLESSCESDRVARGEVCHHLNESALCGLLYVWYMC